MNCSLRYDEQGNKERNPKIKAGRLERWGAAFFTFVVVAVYAVMYTFKFHKAWNEYQANGTLPVEKEKKK